SARGDGRASNATAGRTRGRAIQPNESHFASSNRICSSGRAIIVSARAQRPSRGVVRGGQMDGRLIETRRAHLETGALRGRHRRTGADGGGDCEMNWANRLTMSRLVLTIAFVAALNSSWHYARTSALIIFIVAG